MDKKLEVEIFELSYHIGKSFGNYIDSCIEMSEMLNAAVHEGRVEFAPRPYEIFNLFAQRVYSPTDIIPFLRNESRNRSGPPLPSKSMAIGLDDFSIISTRYYVTTNVDIQEMILKATNEKLIEALENSRLTIVEHIRRYNNYLES